MSELGIIAVDLKQKIIGDAEKKRMIKVEKCRERRRLIREKEEAKKTYAREYSKVYRTMNHEAVLAKKRISYMDSDTLARVRLQKAGYQKKYYKSKVKLLQENEILKEELNEIMEGVNEKEESDDDCYMISVDTETESLEMKSVGTETDPVESTLYKPCCLNFMGNCGCAPYFTI